MSIRSKLALLPLLAAAVIGASTVATAQTAPVSWSVQPATATGVDQRAAFNYDLKPGATQSDFVAVTNLSDRPLTLRIYASDAFNTPGGGFDLLAAGKPSVDVGTWVKIAGESVTVPARGRTVLPFTLTVPQNATPGDHVAGVVASIAGTGRDASGGQVAIDYRVGTRVYLRVDGPLNPRMAVEQPRISYASTSNPAGKGGINASYTVRNDGNVRFAAGQRVIVKGPLGIKLRETRLPDLPELLPGSVYQSEAKVSGLLPLLRLSAEFVVEPRGGDGNPIAGLDAQGMSSSVWAIPTTQLAVLVGLAVVAYAYLKLKRRKRAQYLAVPTDVSPPGLSPR